MGAVAKSITVMVPCFNEQESLPALFDRLDGLVGSGLKREGTQLRYRLMFVDDGSKDDTRVLIKQYAADRDYTDYIFLSRNFGKEKAMFAGIEAVSTDALVIIDADLQDPPELINEMAELWLQGYEDVYARRRSRKGESYLKRMTSRWYYRVLAKVSSVDIQEDTGDFRLLDRKCVDALKQLDESERNSKALFSWIGFRKIEFLYDRDERAAGETKWNYWRLIQLAMDGITSFTTAPLRIASYTGLIAFVVAVVYAAIITVRVLVDSVDVPGYASLMVVLLLIGGLQLLGLGVIGEYLGRVFVQTKQRPNYLVEEQRLGAGDESSAEDESPESVDKAGKTDS